MFYIIMFINTSALKLIEDVKVINKLGCTGFKNQYYNHTA